MLGLADQLFIGLSPMSRIVKLLKPKEPTSKNIHRNNFFIDRENAHSRPEQQVISIIQRLSF
jgi:hypothetical protein